MPRLRSRVRASFPAPDFQGKAHKLSPFGFKASFQRGALAKRLCSGLQIHLGRFDSGTRLHDPCGFPQRKPFLFLPRPLRRDLGLADIWQTLEIAARSPPQRSRHKPCSRSRLPPPQVAAATPRRQSRQERPNRSRERWQQTGFTRTSRARLTWLPCYGPSPSPQIGHTPGTKSCPTSPPLKTASIPYRAAA